MAPTAIGVDINFSSLRYKMTLTPNYISYTISYIYRSHIRFSHSSLAVSLAALLSQVQSQ
jgi:hypothetical protein